jgi:acyl carrier protein
MDKQQAEQIIAESIKNILHQCGYEIESIESDVCPIRDLPEFDSQLALELTVDLSDKLGFETESNLFFDDKKHCALRIHEVASRILHLLNQEEKN